MSENLVVPRRLGPRMTAVSRGCVKTRNLRTFGAAHFMKAMYLWLSSTREATIPAIFAVFWSLL